MNANKDEQFQSVNVDACYDREVFHSSKVGG